MKNLLLIFVILLCTYLYLHPRETRVAPVAAAPLAVAAPRAPHLYYHSPLDAPAMSTSMSTGAGYYSADPTARFNNFQFHPFAASGAAAGGYSSYGSGGYTANTVIYNTNVSPTRASSYPASSRSYVVGKLPRGGSDGSR